MTRWKAASLHTLPTLLLTALVAAIVLPLWHPWGLYRISGVLPLLGGLAGALLAAGPLLTLIVTQAGKKSLHMDLAVIMLLQIVVLGFGLHLLWHTRPAFVVASDTRFAVVLANEITDDDLARAGRRDWSQLRWNGPHLVSLPPVPGTSSVLATLLDNGMERERQPALYLPYEAIAPRLSITAQASTADGRPVAATTAPAYRSLPILTRHGRGRVVLDASDGQPLNIVTH